MADTLRWGILGTGNIARQFAEGVAGASRSRVVAVGSRDAGRAAGFVDDNNMHCTAGTYADVLADESVDAIYNALPNSMHHEWTLKAFDAGKHVLCEKPMAVDAAEAQAMFDAADRAGLLLAEAFMYQSHPMIKAVLQQLRSGAIGKVKVIRASFCYRTRKIEGNIRFDKSLAGGALMDIGCYCVSLARLIADSEPVEVHGTGVVHESGVDELVTGSLRFGDGTLASFTAGMTAQADNRAMILGDEGYLLIPVPWKPPVREAEFSIHKATPPRQDTAGKVLPPSGPEVFHIDAGKPLYALEADDFAAAVLDGAPLTVTKQHSLGNAVVVDELRRQVGVHWK